MSVPYLGFLLPSPFPLNWVSWGLGSFSYIRSRSLGESGGERSTEGSVCILEGWSGPMDGFGPSLDLRPPPHHQRQSARPWPPHLFSSPPISSSSHFSPPPPPRSPPSPPLPTPPPRLPWGTPRYTQCAPVTATVMVTKNASNICATHGRWVQRKWNNSRDSIPRLKTTFSEREKETTTRIWKVNLLKFDLPD